MPLFRKKSQLERDRQAAIAAARKRARAERKDARQDKRAENKEARQDKRAAKTDARQDKRQAKKDARQDKREATREMREGRLAGREKRAAKQAARSDKKDAVTIARQRKKDAVHEARTTKRDRFKEARQDKRVHAQDAREDRRRALQALRIPKAIDRKWVSYLRFQEFKALEIYKPKSLAQLKTICRLATDNGVRVRAVGSGHSFSEITTTDGILVETHQLDRMLPLGPTARRRRFKTAHHDPDRAPMAEFEVGRTIIDLSKALEETGHALVNQGTYDGQTFWGAVSTSTHGSGLGRQPFPDMVLSVVLVGEGGRTYRIEPRHGITEPRGWSEPGIDELIQNDDVFYSVICSFGSMGIVYSAVIALRDFYWLNEWTFITTWDTFKASFADPAKLTAFVGRWSTISLLASPSILLKGKKDGVSFRGERPLSFALRLETDDRRKIGGRFMDKLAKAFENAPIPIITGKAPAEGHPARKTMTDLSPDDSWMAPAAVRQSGKRGWLGQDLDLDKIPIKRRNKCYRIFPKGGKVFGGYGLELAFPIDRTLEVMERIFTLTDANDAAGRYHTAPIAIRFVKGSEAYASPQYHQSTVMIEILMAKGTKGGARALADIEKAMLGEPDMRVHWGLHMDQMNQQNADFARMYPKWPQFVTTFRRFNQRGTFTNDFTERIGLS